MDGLAIKTPSQSPEFDTRLISSSRMASNGLPLGRILRTTPLRYFFASLFTGEGRDVETTAYRGTAEETRAAMRAGESMSQGRRP